MLYKTNVPLVFCIACSLVFLPACSATIAGLKADLEKAGQKSGLTGSGADSFANNTTESEDSVLFKIQSLLKEHGYYNGEVDGKFTAATEAAIQDFQLGNGLRIDGRPTQQLLAVLEEI